jgi:hypothetical protein
MRRRVIVLFAVGIVWVGSYVWAQNLLSNGDFGTDVAGWTCSGIGTVLWSPFDVDGSSSSGSMQIDNQAANPTGNSTIICTQCVSLGTSPRVRLVAAALFADDPGFYLDGSARIRIIFSDTVGCSNTIDFSELGILMTPPTPADEWWSVSTGWADVPPTATHAQAMLVSWADTYQQPLRLHFDAVNLDVGVTIFEDGFESTNVSFWSAAYP